MACGALCSFLPLRSLSSTSTSTSTSTRTASRSGRLKAAALPAAPNDPFLSKLASVAASNPESLSRSASDNAPPYLIDVFGRRPTTTLRGSPPSQMESYSDFNQSRVRSPPPDMASLLLHGRIVFIGLPLVPAVSELVIAQLLFLQYDNDTKPIYMYINSTGTTDEGDVPIALDTEGFAIYDAMGRVSNDVETVSFGFASGQACMLLAAGKKGRRFMLPGTRVLISEPAIAPIGQMSATRVAIRAKEILHYKDRLARMFARHTGHPLETILNIFDEGGRYFDAKQAREFRIIDKILFENKQMMDNVASPEEWDRRAGIKDDEM